MPLSPQDWTTAMWSAQGSLAGAPMGILAESWMYWNVHSGLCQDPHERLPISFRAYYKVLLLTYKFTSTSFWFLAKFHIHIHFGYQKCNCGYLKHMNGIADVIHPRKNDVVDIWNYSCGWEHFSVNIWNVHFDQEELNYGYLQFISSVAIKC